jgi:hypothetical protein
MDDDGGRLRDPLALAAAAVAAGAVVTAVLGLFALLRGDAAGWLGLAAGAAGVPVAYRLGRSGAARDDDDLDPEVMRRIGSADGDGQSSHVRVLP